MLRMLRMLVTNLKVSTNYFRVVLILSSMFWFSLIYMLYPDEDFTGVNSISELIKKELLKEKVMEDIKKQKENTSTEGFELQGSSYDKKSDSIEKDVKKIEETVEDEYTSENIQKSVFEQYFSRVYFSIITGCLLGYGDVYPTTIRCKAAVMTQALLTVIIIVM